MKKLKKKIEAIFEAEKYDDIIGKKFIKEFLKNNRKKIKNDDVLKLTLRFCIAEYEKKKDHIEGWHK